MIEGLKLEVKKLEKRDTKQEATSPYTWACGINPDLLGEIMNGCSTGCSNPC
ncbi:MAG: hypothetical protein SVJ22_08005 [Halobacteriota archaeon]|nr:hypothetical protein [Halobacteriota archaeon]